LTQDCPVSGQNCTPIAPTQCLPSGAGKHGDSCASGVSACGVGLGCWNLLSGPTCLKLCRTGGGVPDCAGLPGYDGGSAVCSPDSVLVAGVGICI
jgi:hypothetical protein